MTTELSSEHRAISAVGFFFSRRIKTASSAGEHVVGEAIGEATTGQMSEYWDVIAPLAVPNPPDDFESALTEFSNGMRDLPQVVGVSHAKDRGLNLVWTFIRRRDKDVRRQVYAQERSLMARYPRLVFDFNVVALDQGVTGALVPDDLQGRLILYRSPE